MTQLDPTNDPFSQPTTAFSAGVAVATAGTEYDDNVVARDRYGRYLLPDYTKTNAKKPKAFTRATTFAKSISDTYTLSQWAQRMAIKGVTMRPDLYAAVAATDIDDRDALNGFAETAKEVAGAKNAANLGTALHAFTEQHDRGEAPNVPPPWDRDLQAYSALIDANHFEIVPEYIERIVIETTFEIAGTFDRIVRVTEDTDVVMPDGTMLKLLEGELVVLDLKTGRDLSYGWNEIAIQLALYANSKYIYNRPLDRLDELPAIRTDVAFVVHLPVGKAKATLHALDITEGWKAAALCKMVRDWRKVRKLAVPLAVAEVDEVEGVLAPDAGGAPIKVTAERVDPAQTAAVALPDLVERINACTTEAEVRAVRHAAQLNRTWTVRAEEHAVKRLHAIWADTTAG